jgi:hypothetical protein
MTKYMKGWVVCFVLGTILFSQASYGLEGDIIYLHNGSSITGEIIESVPGASFTLKRRDGTIHVFKMTEVWKVKFEEEEVYEDRLYLKDGSVIIGIIIGAIPGETYRIRTEDKSILVFRMEEVGRLELKTLTPKVEVITPILPTKPQPPVTKQPSSIQPSVLEEKGLAGVMGVNLNYPGLGLRIGVSRRLLLELRTQRGNNVSAYGLRGYYYFNPKRDKLSLFAGVEADIISFKGEVSEGNGFAVIGFLGGEYFLSKKFSLQLDFGPAYYSITDKGSNLSESGLDYLVNVGLNFYLRGKGEAKR